MPFVNLFAKGCGRGLTRLRFLRRKQILNNYHAFPGILGVFNMEEICQSCAMPLQKQEDFGTNADGSKSKDYCFHCFQGGKFLDEGITLQGKIEKNVGFAKMMGMAEEQARQMASTILPKLKRWKK
jgi:hypothetical protein